uniref:ribbon-helix-helix protein, CopG family n=1 Tax=Eubacterium sp. TaxID=142586 RepID=UPI004029C1D4
MPEEKRKTTTSSAVKRRYNDKVYSVVKAELPKELVAEFKKLCKEKGVSQASVIKNALEQFINENRA